jgi:hypothetical protein
VSNLNEVIILCVWGCGAYCNPIAIVSKLFAECLKDYNFPIVVFALGKTMSVQRSSSNAFTFPAKHHIILEQ